jgi:hypothetical protein
MAMGGMAGTVMLGERRRSRVAHAAHFIRVGAGIETQDDARMGELNTSLPITRAARSPIESTSISALRRRREISVKI